MKKLIIGILATISIGSPVFSKQELYTVRSMDCMIAGRCIDNVYRVKNINDIRSQSEYYSISQEFNSIVSSLNKIGVKVFVGPEKYFPTEYRGIYHTESNNFYLNESHIQDPEVLISIMRHEGWHVAQDCMAGSIKNPVMALLYPEKKVPQVWYSVARKLYSKSEVPFEAEAKWAGNTKGMTSKALKVCSNGKMWNTYESNQSTRQWLRQEGYIN